MTDSGPYSELSQREEEIVREMSLDYRRGIDVEEVREIVSDPERGRGLLDFSLGELPPEERLAKIILRGRTAEGDEQHIQQHHLHYLERMIESGIRILQEDDVYYLYEPCVECIFELDDEELERLYAYLREFESSEYANALSQYRNEVFQRVSDIGEIESETQSIAEMLELYSDIASLYEIAFPNLLALKRILDGEDPENEVLQRKDASSVRRELQNSEKELNSAYFDLIVKQYDRRLRNGLAHGDIVTDTVEEKVRVPSEGTEYSFAELREVVESNHHNAIFVTGVYRGLGKWRFLTQGMDTVSREWLEI